MGTWKTASCSFSMCWAGLELGTSPPSHPGKLRRTILQPAHNRQPSKSVAPCPFAPFKDKPSYGRTILDLQSVLNPSCQGAAYSSNLAFADVQVLYL